MFLTAIAIGFSLLLFGREALADEPGAAAAALDPQRFDLSEVSDRTELAFEESEAYYAILDHVREVPPGELRERAAELHRSHWQASPRFREWPEAEFPLFYDMTQRPQEYRGQPVSLRGHLVRLIRYAAGPNEHGVDTLYEGWLVTDDSATHPTTVICTRIPPGMPIGEELIDGVSVTGYFFKLHTYAARDRKIRFAPMILAHRLSWSPESAAGTGWAISPPLVIAAVAVLAVLIMSIAVVSSRKSRRERDERFRGAVPQTPPKFLNDLSS